MSLPAKRSAITSVASSTSTSSSNSTPAMKKAKSQPLEPSKNGLRLHDRSEYNPTSTSEESVPMALDEDLKPEDSGDGAVRAVAANLSRKKATPPQPSKKLVIKLVKGILFWIVIVNDMISANVILMNLNWPL